MHRRRMCLQWLPTCCSAAPDINAQLKPEDDHAIATAQAARRPVRGVSRFQGKQYLSCSSPQLHDNCNTQYGGRTARRWIVSRLDAGSHIHMNGCRPCEQVFVANPDKPAEIASILAANKPKLIAFLQGFQNEKGERSLHNK